ncbi:hypothetical protein [Tepidanaerobacter syntrophicus]|nr:hypothetical protein [Tepidanaerobacter syntrophicus]
MGELYVTKASGASIKDALLKERYKSLEPISLFLMLSLMKKKN